MSSLPSFSTARLMTCQRISTGRTFSTSSIHREAIHAQGHRGSNQKSTTVGSCSAMALPLLLMITGSSADDHGYRTSAGTACLGHNSPGWVPLALTGPGAPAFRWRRGKMPEWSVPGRTPAGPRRKDHQVASDLTRDEARERARLLDVGSYRVEVDLTGVDQIGVDLTGGESTFVDLTARGVREIVLNATPVSLDAFDGDRIGLADLQADNELRVVAECAYSRSGEGLHRFADPVDGGVYLYSDLET